MIPRRLLAAGAAVVVLLAVAGIASQGRPLSADRGSGPSAVFFDYVATTLVLFAVAMLVVVVVAALSNRTRGNPPRRGTWHLFSYLGAMVVGVAIATLILQTGFAARLRNAAEQMRNRNPPAAEQPRPADGGRNVRNARLRWDEIAVVAVLVGGTLVVLLAARNARRAPRPWRLRREEAVARTFDESLDDLRTDPDLRRAIIAAYARMERALTAVGLGRHPAEAPFEYVARALASLDTSAASAERLTALFEWAKFSQHEPGPEMRDEAVAALEAIRDELRRPAPEPVTA